MNNKIELHILGVPMNKLDNCIISWAWPCSGYCHTTVCYFYY